MRLRRRERSTSAHMETDSERPAQLQFAGAPPSGPACGIREKTGRSWPPRGALSGEVTSAHAEEIRQSFSALPQSHAGTAQARRRLGGEGAFCSSGFGLIRSEGCVPRDAIFTGPGTRPGSGALHRIFFRTSSVSANRDCNKRPSRMRRSRS